MHQLVTYSRVVGSYHIKGIGRQSTEQAGDHCSPRTGSYRSEGWKGHGDTVARKTGFPFVCSLLELLPRFSIRFPSQKKKPPRVTYRAKGTYRPRGMISLSKTKLPYILVSMSFKMLCVSLISALLFSLASLSPSVSTASNSNRTSCMIA